LDDRDPVGVDVVEQAQGLQQFFKWLLVDEQAISRSPMERVRPPKTPTKLVPVMREANTVKVLDACRGKGFAGLRDEALIRCTPTRVRGCRRWATCWLPT
jgi:site-specific recombinase XerD